MTFAEPTRGHRCLRLVHGYHPDSYPPSRAYDHGLRDRFAIIFETWCSNKPDMFFDADLFLRLIASVCGAINHDSMAIWVEHKFCFRSLDELALYYSELSEDDQEPPVRIDLYQGSDLVGMMATEFWTMLGGPPPYHDSYTFSFYSAQDRFAEFKKLCEDVCTEADAQMTDVFLEERERAPYHTWWQRLLRWCGFKISNTGSAGWIER